MKKRMIYVYIIILSTLLIGCEGKNNASTNDTTEYTENENVIDYNVEDIRFEWLPEMEYTTERKSINDMKKFVCYFAQETVYDREIMIGVNIEKKKLYVNKGMGGMDGSDSTCTLDDGDIEELLNVIEKYKIQDWEYKYETEKYEDVDNCHYAWDIYMQYGDGSVEKHCGEGYSFNKEEIKPPNYDEFRAAMVEYADKFLVGFCGLDLAERTRDVKSLEQAKKVVCIFMQEDEDSEEEIIAIDIENKKLYIGYDINEIDRVEPDCILTDSDIEEVLNIIETYKVQEWEQFYKYKEGESSKHYIWTIYIENKDRTVERHYGLTDTFNNAGVKPPNYDEFKVAMEEFADRCINRGL